MTGPEKMVTEEWIEILRAGRVLPQGAGEVTEEGLASIASAFTDPVPVVGEVPFGEPEPRLAEIHAVEVRRDDRGAYLAGLVRPARLGLALASGHDPARGPVTMTFSPSWIASGPRAGRLLNAALSFGGDPAQAGDASPRGEIVAAPTIVCGLRVFDGLDLSRECPGRAELVGIERWAIASASPRPGRDGRAVAGDRYVGPQAAHYICQACQGRTIVELPDGTGSPGRSRPVEVEALRDVVSPFARGMLGMGLGLGGTADAALAHDAAARESAQAKIDLARRGAELWGVNFPRELSAALESSARRRYLSASFVEDGVPIAIGTTRREKSKYGRAPRQVRQDRNSKAREKILANGAR